MTTRSARVARGLVAAFVATFIAACSHALSGGSLPGLTGVALCLAFSSVVCVLLAGRSLSWFRLSIAVSISQFLFHALFSVMAGGSSPFALQPGSAATGGGHDMMSHLLTVTGSSTPMAMPSDPWMWLGHASAAVLTVVVLRKGEQSFWNLITLASLLLARLCSFATAAPVNPAPASPAPAADRARLPQLRMILLGLHRHRGPPAFAPTA